MQIKWILKVQYVRILCGNTQNFTEIINASYDVVAYFDGRFSMLTS